jgi:hypothetical protein
MISTASELLAAINDHPTTVINYQFPKEDAKKKIGATAQFVNLTFNLGGNKKSVPGFFSFRDAQLSRGVTDPNNINPESQEHHVSVRLMARFKVSQIGDYGKALIALEPIHTANFNRLVAEGKIIKGKKQDLHSLIQTHYPEDCKDKEKANKAIEDPLVKLKISFDKYSEKHPTKALQGRVKTVILDASKKFTDPTGKQSFEEATIDGEKLNADNVHLFLNKGAVVKYGVINIASLVGSAGWWSVPITAHTLLVQTGTAGEDLEADDLNSIAAEMSGLPAPAQVVVKPATEDELGDLIDGLEN